MGNGPLLAIRFVSKLLSCVNKTNAVYESFIIAFVCVCVRAHTSAGALYAHTCLSLFFVGAGIWGVGKAKHDHGSVIRLARKNRWEVLRIIKFLPKVHSTILTSLQMRSYLVKYLESKQTFWHNWHNLSLQLFNFAFNNDKSILNMHHFNPNPAI